MCTLCFIFADCLLWRDDDDKAVWFQFCLRYEEQNYIPERVCKGGNCWTETFYPFMKVNDEDSHKHTLALGLAFLIFIIYFTVITSPFLGEILKVLYDFWFVVDTWLLISHCCDDKGGYVSAPSDTIFPKANETNFPKANGNFLQGQWCILQGQWQVNPRATMYPPRPMT